MPEAFPDDVLLNLKAVSYTHLDVYKRQSPVRVGIKATTNEQLGALGRREGIAAFAVAAILMPEDLAMPEGECSGSVSGSLFSKKEAGTGL